MIYRIKIGDQYFNVEINDLNNRPIHACVNGTDIEVWPEECTPQIPGRAETQLPASKPRLEKQISQKTETPPPSNNPPQENGNLLIKSPLPGTIHFIAVEPGSEVTVGQELLIIESMKMKNAIRAKPFG